MQGNRQRNEDILIIAARNGDRKAIGELIISKTSSLRRFAARRVPPHLLDDAVAEGRIALLKALGDYRPGRMGFWSFAEQYVRSALRQYRRYEHRNSFECEETESPHTLNNPEVLVSQKEQLLQLLQHLTPAEKTFIEKRLAGDDTPARSHAIQSRIRRKILKHTEAS